jgi:hypothetical protein
MRRLLLVFALASFTGCSHRKSIDRDDVRSELRSARSFAAESEIFIDFVLQGHAIRRYAAGHSAYLEDAIEESAKELDQGVPQSDAKDSARECQTQLRMLARELSGIRAAIGKADKNALVAARGRIRQIRQSLETANSYL